MLKLKELRKKYGYTQQNIADKLNVQRTTITNYENGTSEPDINSIKKLAEIFNVSIGYLLDSEENNKEKSKGIKIPVLGTIPAGIPIEAIEDILDYEEISEDMAKKGDYFALKVKGDSMLPTIKDGDIVIIKKCDDAESGKICVIMINGYDATLKEIKKDPDNQGLWILPHNHYSDYKPTFYSNKEIESLPIRIIGVAVEIRRSL